MDFELQPTLKGELLELRPLRAGDFVGLFAAASGPLIWEQHPESDRHTAEKIGAVRAGSRVVDGRESLVFEITSRSVDPARLAASRPPA